MTQPCGAILAIGDELAIGQSLDTNTRWIAEQLTARSLHIIEHTTLPDDQHAITDAILRLAQHADFIIITGGLGPTADDLTRQSLAEALSEPLVEDDRALAFLEDIERKRGRSLTPARRSQALRPASASIIDNPTGTAPGLRAVLTTTARVTHIFCLPGPPREMVPMFEGAVLPALPENPTHAIRTRILRCYGIPEADAAAALADLMRRDRNPLVGTTASNAIISIRIRYEGDPGAADSSLSETERQVRAAVGPYIFGAEDDTLPAVTLGALREAGDAMLVAESCTGGLTGAMLTEIPGSSDVFLGGWITYANEMKSAHLAVPAADLQSPDIGAVSAHTARNMARAALANAPDASRSFNRIHSVAITGIAGPSGGSDRKPVGTVFIAAATRDNNSGVLTDEVRHFLIAGDREDIRIRSATTAIGMTLHRFRNSSPETLLWQVAPPDRAEARA